MNNSTHNARIELALASLRQQNKPNIHRTAKEFSLVESTLRRRWNGKSVSRKASASEHRQRLTDVQEEALIGQINRLTDRGLPPTSSIIRSIAEEMI